MLKASQSSPESLKKARQFAAQSARSGQKAGKKWHFAAGVEPTSRMGSLSVLNAEQLARRGYPPCNSRMWLLTPATSGHAGKCSRAALLCAGLAYRDCLPPNRQAAFCAACTCRRVPIVIFSNSSVIRLILIFAISGSLFGFWAFYGIISLLVSLLTLAAWVVLMIMAYQGKWFEVPIAAGICSRTYRRASSSSWQVQVSDAVSTADFGVRWRPGLLRVRQIEDWC